MEYIIVISIILIISSALSILLKKRIEKIIPISVIIMVLIPYLTGIFDNIKIGVLLVEILAVLCAIIIVYYVFKSQNNKKEIAKIIFTPGLIIYIVLSAIFIFMNKGRIFANLDEFNHWGRIIKDMFLYNTFGTHQESIVIYNEYPPFTAIFQYIFLSVRKVYSEDIVITANSILYLSIIIPFTENIKWKNNLKNLGILIPSILFLPVIFYEDFYIEILVDALIGVMFANVIYTAYKEKDINFKYIKIFTYLVMLTLTKTSGIGLAILALIIIIIKFIKGRKCNSNIETELRNLIIVVLLVTTFTALWNIKTSNITKNWDFNIEVQDNVKLTKQNLSHIIKGILIYKQDITYKELSVIAVFLILICTNFYVLKKAKEQNNTDYKYYSISMLITIPIYLLFILYTYVFLLNFEEAINIASHSRYCSTILLANAMFQLYAIFGFEQKFKIKHLIILCAIIMSFINLNTLNEKYLNKEKYIRVCKVERSAYTTFDKFSETIEKNSKILFIATDRIRLPFIKSINEYTSGILITEIIAGNFKDEEDFKKIAQEYDYIFIYRIKDDDKEIISNIVRFNNVENDTLYEVICNNNDVVLQKSM